jgi:hypothetical protein
VGRSGDTLHGNAAATGIIGKYVNRDFGGVDGDGFAVWVRTSCENVTVGWGVDGCRLNRTDFYL